MEPLQQVVNVQADNSHPPLMGLIHLIAWSIFILAIVFGIKFMKRLNQQDERMKKFENKNIIEELKKEEENLK